MKSTRQDSGSEMEQAVDALEKNLREHVYALAHTIGERNYRQREKLVQAGEYIVHCLEEYGYTLRKQQYSIENNTYSNIIARAGGNREKKIILGAHYDTAFGCPGADDNASGIAVMLETARLCRKENKDGSCWGDFVAFVNEEPPFFQTPLMGSMQFAGQAKEHRERIDAMICLESVGFYADTERSQTYPPGLGFAYPDKGNFIAIVGNTRSRQLVRRAQELLRRNMSLPTESLIGTSIIPGVAYSDHASFWHYGFSALMLTDTAFYRNQYYHSEEDTVEKLQYVKMADLTHGIVALMQWL